MIKPIVHIVLLLALILAPLGHLHAGGAPTGHHHEGHGESHGHGNEPEAQADDGVYVPYPELEPACLFDHDHGDCWLCWLALVPRQPVVPSTPSATLLPSLFDLSDFYPPPERRPPKHA